MITHSRGCEWLIVYISLSRTANC